MKHHRDWQECESALIWTSMRAGRDSFEWWLFDSQSFLPTSEEFMEEVYAIGFLQTVPHWIPAKATTEPKTCHHQFRWSNTQKTKQCTTFTPLVKTFIFTYTITCYNIKSCICSFIIPNIVIHDKFTISFIYIYIGCWISPLGLFKGNRENTLAHFYQ